MKPTFRQILFFIAISFSFMPMKRIEPISNVQFIVEGAIVIEGQIVNVSDSSFTVKIIDLIQGKVNDNLLNLELRRNEDFKQNSKYLFFIGKDYLSGEPTRIRYHDAYHPIVNDSIWISNERKWYSIFSEKYTFENNPFRSKPFPLNSTEFKKAVRDLNEEGEIILKKLMEEPDIIKERAALNIKLDRPKKLEMTDDFILNISTKSKSHEYLINEFINDIAQKTNYHFNKK
jgi:hypothetical protein